MTRLLLGAFALACVSLLGACNAPGLTTSDISSLTAAAATTSPTLPPSATVSKVLADAGVSPAGQKAVNANIATVQKAATALCKIKPLASGLLNIGIALSPSLATVAGSAVAQEVGGAATIACNALASAPTYAALGNRKGELITAYVSIGRFDRVPVYGVRTR